MTVVTAAREGRGYLLLIEASRFTEEFETMTRTKLYSLILAAALIAPVAFATLNQASLIFA